MLPALASATATKVLECVFCIMLFYVYMTPRRGFVPQAQAAQQRLKHAFAS
jgi:hypothetical protein